jgi:serine/threonine protein kinase
LTFDLPFEMSLPAGAKIGPYEIVALLGAGGMGKSIAGAARGRDIALKILLPNFAADAERMARFQREAQVLASLNHPHIASLYGLEDGDGVRALVMELVEGPKLHVAGTSQSKTVDRRADIPP